MQRFSRLSPQEAKKHPYGHVVTRTVGSKEVDVVDTLLFDLLPEDVFILCSDGLTRYVDSNGDLLEVIESYNIKEVPQYLVNWANKQGGADNISVVAVEIQITKSSPKKDTENLKAQRQFQAIQKIDFLKELPLRDHLKIANLLEEKFYKKNDILIEKKQKSSSFYIVANGSVCFFEGNKLVRKFRKGEYFGENVLIASYRMKYEAKTTEGALLWKISQENFTKLVRRNPRLGLKVFRNLGSKLINPPH